MNAAPQWWGAPASSIGHAVDALFYSLVGLTGATGIALAVLVIVFCIRYRRGSPADRTHPPRNVRSLEIAWVLVPLGLFLATFAAATAIYPRFHVAPPGATTVYVLGKQWMWRIEHEDGRREINELHLPVGQPVRLVMTSQDVIHSFFVPAFRVKQDLLPGRYTSIVFTPTREGEFAMTCAEFCGAKHPRMGGRVVVMREDRFAEWRASGDPQPSLATQGFDLYRRLGCSGCHEAGSTVHAPSLRRIYGRVVHLAGGATVVADEQYLRDSILLPSSQRVAGYADQMPSFQGQLSEGDLLALLAWLRGGGQ